MASEDRGGQGKRGVIVKQSQLNRIEAGLTALQAQVDFLTQQLLVLVRSLDEDDDDDAEPIRDLDGDLIEAPSSTGSSLDEDGDAA